MGKHYNADLETPFFSAFWKSQRECAFVEESVEGSGVWFFRNLNGKGAAPRDLTNGAADATGAAKALVSPSSPSAMSTAMSSSRNVNAKRRFSQGVSAKALPVLLAE